MCGIFGVIAKSDNYEIDLLSNIVNALAKLSESRGRDSSGFAVRNNLTNEIRILRGPVTISNLLRTVEYSDEINLLKKSKNNSKDNLVFSVMGHSRLVTNGTQLNDDNNQPVSKDGIVSIHNGIIVNVDNLWEKHLDIQRQYEIDTEIFCSLLNKSIKANHDFHEAINQTFTNLIGTVSTALFFRDYNNGLLYSNNGALYILTNFEDILIFASEKNTLTEISKRFDWFNSKSFSLKKVAPNTGYLISFNEFKIEQLFLAGYRENSSELSPVKSYSILIKNIQQKNKQLPKVISINNFSLMSCAHSEQKLLQYNIEEIRSLKRCTKCLLPESFPFIKFNDSGVCNICLEYKPKSGKKNEKDFLEILEKYRKHNSEPDCILPFSGGRDSSYALHYIKKEWGLNPITFTYDWGMVTDLARRNIARLCGKLGVENIVIAADIEKKRNNIRKNILAWLKQPKLGMIPLFMAGDKMFVYYTYMLKKQYDIQLNIWGTNFLEYTEFKVGFSGISIQHDKKRIDYLSVTNQLKLFSNIFSNLVTNPSYLNSSVVDTLKGYLARFVIGYKDYYPFFTYVKWDEKKIENLILKEYDWEKSNDTESTWRIGDGTAAFYNYIYFTVAGFSECDTFRSNQIREGMLTRDEALNLVYKENFPRYESLKWYLEILGLDFWKGYQKNK